MSERVSIIIRPAKERGDARAWAAAVVAVAVRLAQTGQPMRDVVDLERKAA